ncbi:MAG: hypothetical protein IMY85_05360, partial [Chloroflexi bacterium]|nr:hypothetical protein [Chloroflexota bacterium]
FGFGTQLSPEIPYYGPWQAMGVLVGEIIIVLGFIFQIPFRLQREESDNSIENKENSEASTVDMVFE